MTALGLLALWLPGAAAAQGFGLGVKAGTIGVGVEGALALGSMVNLRAGGALLPVSFDATLEDIDWTIELPSSYLQVGLDLYPTGGGFRLMGGLLYKPDEPRLEADLTSSQEIGGREYTPAEIGTLVGSVESSSLAPFLGIGFGKHTNSGFGFYADLGAAFLGEPALVLEQQGGTMSDAERAEFQTRLETERREVEADLQADEMPQRLLKIWPVLQVGLRIGLGG
jgi:hypothetical protein